MNASSMAIDSVSFSLRMDYVELLDSCVDLKKGKKELVITNSTDMALRDWRRIFAVNSYQTLQFFLRNS